MNRDDRYRVALVCLGNICRSPMAHVVLESKLVRADLDDRVEVSSAGTGGWHVGDPMDHRAAATLRGHGYDPTRHRARQFTRDWFADHDLVLTMDERNHADVVDLAPTVEDHDRVRMFRSFDPRATPRDLEVPDPYYGGPDGFEDVLTMVERTSDAVVADLRDRLRASR